MENSDLFEMLYDKYFDKIYKSTYMITLNDSITEDAVQEAFISAFNNFDKLRDIKKFHAWVAVIASNKAIDMIRKNSRIYPSDQLDSLHQKYSLEDPLDLILDKENKLKIINALNKLNLSYRQVVILRYYYDLPFKDIGEVLGISAAAVKSRFHRAKNTLKKLLESQKSQEGREVI
ncbi:MAG TPA: RNA polymerase sigma factor [Thermoanaerobacterales bacterium]|nr:RNA polymerase sigma factor [Thermoanaerobacterales bacterium]